MSLRSIVLAASLFAIAGSAAAHDPILREPSDVPRAKPITCAQLADRKHYSNDLTDPHSKALQQQCDTANEADAHSAAAKKH